MALGIANRLPLVLLAALAAGSALGCDSRPLTPGETDAPDTPGTPGTGDTGKIDTGDDPLPTDQVCTSLPACDASLTVDPAGPALLITDPTVLEKLPLKRVVEQTLALAGVDMSATEAMQRFFDTMNSTADGKFSDVRHCDDPVNPAMFFTLEKDALTCPRAEGALAHSEGLLTDGDPDSFFPVAVVNRFDLTPADGFRCGQYRIIYAKRSGLTDPDDRVFLIFEAALENPLPGCLEKCSPIAQFWHGLQGKSPAEIAAEIEGFFFDGLPGFNPAVHPRHFGFDAPDAGYGAHEGGQIRVSMHMQDPWDMREMRFDRDPEHLNPSFVPTTVKNNPPPSHFDPALEDVSGLASPFRSIFAVEAVLPLARNELHAIQMSVAPEFNGGESVLDGDGKNDYVAIATSSSDTSFLEEIDQNIAGLPDALTTCPPGDPLDAAAILKRATALSCAGCHAPKDLLGPDRSIGCGLVWPDSIGQVHVTEKGQLSPALQNVFLPRRAEVLQSFVQACDLKAIKGDLQTLPPGSGAVKVDLLPEGAMVRTLGGSVSH